MSEPILPTHVLPSQHDVDKHEIPGSFPTTESNSPRARQRPRRKTTNLTIDSAVEPEDYRDTDVEAGLYTSSPLSENMPQSGSPILHERPMRRISTRARKASRQKKNKKHRRDTQENQGAWLHVSEELGEHDEKMVRGWNEQIDTLLVFAGLFSAVITEFNNEAYQLLLPDPVEESKAILGHISVQLTYLPEAIRSGAPIPALTTPPPFEATLADITVSTLWYSSLVCALIAASLGMLVKQWLQHYMRDDYSSTRERLRVRELRFKGLCRWQVPAIVAFLPLLLRIALTLFLAGLIVFMHTLHPIVMWSVTSLIILWLLSYSSSLVFPSAYSDCPYKAPESLAFYIVSRIMQDGIRATLTRWAFGSISWCDPEEAVKKDITEDPNILNTYDRTFADNGLETRVRACCLDMDEQSVMQCVNQILRRRLQVRGQIVWDSCDRQEIMRERRLTRRAAETLVNILLDTMERSLDDVALDGMDERSWLTSAFECLILLLETTLWPSETELDKRLTELLLRLAKCVGISDTAPFGEITLGTRYRLYILQILGLRPALLQKELIPLLPFLYAAAGDHFLGKGTAEMTVKICRAILSIVAHTDTKSLLADQGFDKFLSAWEITMRNTTTGLARLPLADRFAVKHDVHCCLNMAQELGSDFKAEDLCMQLEKALDRNWRESGSDFTA